MRARLAAVTAEEKRGRVEGGGMGCWWWWRMGGGLERGGLDDVVRVDEEMDVFWEGVSWEEAWVVWKRRSWRWGIVLRSQAAGTVKREMLLVER